MTDSETTGYSSSWSWDEPIQPYVEPAKNDHATDNRWTDTAVQDRVTRVRPAGRPHDAARPHRTHWWSRANR